MDKSSLIFENKYSAPGKFILTGEHSVVHGKDAIVATLDARTQTTIQLYKIDPQQHTNCMKVDLLATNEKFTHDKEIFEDFLQKEYSFNSFEQFIENQKEKIETYSKDPYTPRIKYIYFYMRSLAFACQTFRNDETIIKKLSNAFLKDYRIEITSNSDLPISKGIGSSASYLVTISAAFISVWRHICRELNLNSKVKDINHLKEKICELAFDFESIYHSTPSGLDNTAATFGGLTLFNRVSKLKQRIQMGILHNYKVLVIDSGLEKSTKKTVTMIKNMSESQNIGAPTKSIIDSIDHVTKAIKEILEINHQEQTNEKLETLYTEFEQLIKYNQNLLRALNLSNPTIDEIETICTSHGAAMKITGGGQGGYCVGFIRSNDPRCEELEQKLKEKGYEVLKQNFEDQGLIIHE